MAGYTTLPVPFDNLPSGGGYAPSDPYAGVPGGGGSSGSGYFFTDPIQKYYEGAIRSRIGQVQTDLPTTLPGADEFKNLLGQMGGGTATANYPGSSLGSFQSFVNSFNPGVAQDFNAYAAGRTPGQDTAGLQAYAAGRNPLSGVNEFQQGITDMGPNNWLAGLQGYMQGRDPGQAAGTLQTWMQNNPGVPQNYLDSLAQRVTQLRGNPFDDTQLQARRVAAFSDIETARAQDKQRVMEEMASRGIDNSSGLIDRAMRQIDQNYGAQRASAQNAMTQEEFALRESHMQQADQLEQQGAAMQMNAQQFAGTLTGQIAQLQQQGLSMTDAMAQGLAGMGIQDRTQQQAVLAQVAQLTQAGYQMQDALQTALTTAGLQARAQADSLRQAGAQIGLQQAGMGADLQGQLAGFGTQERGQDTQLQAAIANANSSLYGSNAGALANYYGLRQGEQQYNDQRAQSGVTLAGLLDAMARGALQDYQSMLPTLPNG